MTSPLDLEFVAVLLRSPTFWDSVVVYAGLATALVPLALWLLGRGTRRRRLRELHDDTNGGSTVIDFTLTAPFFMIVVMLIIQFALLANGALLVHYAAYAGARAARVHAWIYPDDLGIAANLNPIDGPIPNLEVDALSIPESLRPFQTAAQAADRAARLALVAAAPAARRIPKAKDAKVPEALYQAMGEAHPFFNRTWKRGGRIRSLQEKARFAFDPEHAVVTTGFLKPNPLAIGQSVLLGRPIDCSAEPAQCDPMGVPLSPGAPVTVGVRFRLWLSLPIASRIWCAIPDTCEEVKGHYFRVATARVTLL
jgi:Flp pilus assembly protein TadG